MLNYVLILSMLTFTACSESTPVKPHSYEAFRFMSECKTSFKKQYNLNPYSVGGCLSGNIQELDMSFTTPRSDKLYSIEEARQLLVTLVEEIYMNVNNDECIRPYLDSYPFERNKLMIAINFTDESGRFIKNQQLASVNLNGYNIFYSTYSHESGFKTIYKETYEEALEIVRRQQESCL